MHAELGTDGVDLGLEALLDRLASDPEAVTLAGEDWPVHDLPGLRVVPVQPVPLFPWWAVWRTTSPHPDSAGFVGALHRAGVRPEPGDGVWLPAASPSSPEPDGSVGSPA